MIKMNKNKIIKIIVIFLVAISYIAAVIFIFGCSSCAILEEAYMDEENGIELPQVEIDEKEISGIGKLDIEGEKSYDIDRRDDPARDPFEPYYTKDEEEEEENMFKLERIYTKDGIDYVELIFNDHTYQLEEGDTLSDIYLVHSINPDSVVLLKGDDILHIFMGTVVYD